MGPNLQSAHVVSRQSRLSVYRVPFLVKLLIRAPIMCEFGVVMIIISQLCNSGVNRPVIIIGSSSALARGAIIKRWTLSLEKPNSCKPGIRLNRFSRASCRVNPESSAVFVRLFAWARKSCLTRRRHQRNYTLGPSQLEA